VQALGGHERKVREMDEIEVRWSTTEDGQIEFRNKAARGGPWSAVTVTEALAVAAFARKWNWHESLLPNGDIRLRAQGFDIFVKKDGRGHCDAFGPGSIIETSFGSIEAAKRWCYEQAE
jgi:hypothetical protein